MSPWSQLGLICLIQVIICIIFPSKVLSAQLKPDLILIDAQIEQSTDTGITWYTRHNNSALQILLQPSSSKPSKSQYDVSFNTRKFSVLVDAKFFEESLANNGEYFLQIAFTCYEQKKDKRCKAEEQDRDQGHEGEESETTCNLEQDEDTTQLTTSSFHVFRSLRTHLNLCRDVVVQGKAKVLEPIDIFLDAKNLPMQISSAAESSRSSEFCKEEFNSLLQKQQKKQEKKRKKEKPEVDFSLNQATNLIEVIMELNFKTTKTITTDWESRVAEVLDRGNANSQKDKKSSDKAKSKRPGSQDREEPEKDPGFLKKYGFYIGLALMYMILRLFVDSQQQPQEQAQAARSN